ncbi:MAG: ABC transporter ATP-binding protein [Acetobacterium woodii]|nr:ABC transporter ATP-binding protein [Acetobacterium woodii]MBI5677826.1 ABC transporter ATP-binding protein [Planctomycetota bacterium]
MSDIVIKAEALGKLYTIGHEAQNERYLALRDVLMHNARNLWNKTKDLAKGTPIIQGDTMEEVWALRDASFEIHRGEAVGIIGHNGAGKSTLLKVLSRITEPSAGRVTIKGRVASLLEVGTGFHPELTGRENIYLNGAILGMTRQEIKIKFDEIVAFAETEKYLDTPVKRYSSGMCVRLAFAVAAHLEPEVLLVDEVLAVGDAEFQKKCLGKMEDVSKTGRTVLFVSHNMLAIESLCKKAILLTDGFTTPFDSVGSAIAEYLSNISDISGEVNWDSPEEAPGNHQVRLKAVRIVSDGQVTATPSIKQDIEVQIDYWNLENNGRRLISLHILNAMGLVLFSTANYKTASLTYDPWVNNKYPIGLFRTTCTIPKFLLNTGTHSITLYINGTMATDNIIFKQNVISLDVQDDPDRLEEYSGGWTGAIRPKLAWKTEKLE